ncbi:hypothetical protein I0622_000986 [Staphylococcus pseudintermedius]|uniref:Uncharacterized protein n=1 Tax=Staphylococcus coagulans TaxID=74706 RepID=A0A9X1EC01_9STAP|nr:MULTISPECIES: hypothetical protein [Staphylococcus]QKN86115.1 hypothetical protein pSpJ_10 [Staphylococcus virus pSp_SNUABM-J]QKN86188.1 hypothetical protein pSpS_08 [Staphylococcus virus pSp_SNUABM-S]EGQ3124426.1 hypothetical protein [Staphylococcus pseudintermedius]EGQ3639938.1 hypothetical protein [Staphylococcus pseudintermedius]EGQ3856902.1 hypothetical protein [Staphylococcus pseudintermedius]
MNFSQDEIAIIYDALYHLECTTDVYSNPYDEVSKAKYTNAFISAFNKIDEFSEKERKGIFYFE